MAEYIEWYGWNEAVGVPLRTILREEWGFDVVDLATDGTGYLVYRLRTEVLQGSEAWRETCRLIEDHHSHHNPPRGWKFGIAVYCGDSPVGVAVVGRPVSRVLAQRGYLEVTRVCTYGPDALRRNATSKLYGACVREARKLGVTQLVTYTLETETGSSLKATNWQQTGKTKGGSWNCPSRPRTDQAPTCRKIRWEYQT
jgi:hypothetical protein